jgi:nucleoside-diphosphate-sugar epimerase
MRITIIGYAGFLGHALTRHLLDLGHMVFGYGPHKADALPVPHIPFDATAGEPDIPEGTDAVFYLSQSPFYRDFPEHGRHLFAVNGLGPLAAAAAASRAGVRFFCFASTGNVYAPSFYPLSEYSPLNRTSPYGLSKIAGEEALDLFSCDMRTLSVRLFGLFGPGQRAMLPWFLQTAVRSGREIFLEPAPGETSPCGGMRISFLFAPDCAAILTSLADAALTGSALPRRLNVAGPAGISIRDFALGLGEVVGREPRFTVSHAPRATDMIADISLLTETLHPKFTALAHALKLTCGVAP